MNWRDLDRLLVIVLRLHRFASRRIRRNRDTAKVC